MRDGPAATVVVGYDGSDAARLAFAEGARRAAAGGRVIVVHSYELPPEFLGSPNYDRMLIERQSRGRALLDDLLEHAHGIPNDLEVETDLLGGPPAQAITQAAKARDADAIVIGSRGLGRLRVAALGSVSNQVLHLADRPVTVVPEQAAEK